MRYLTIQEIAAMNTFVIQQYSSGEQIGIKDHHLLESATFPPQSSMFGEDAYASLFEKAAALFESLAQNHVFFNGNKLTVDVVKHRYTLVELAQLIENHVIYRER